MQVNLTLTDGAKVADPLCVSVVYFQFFHFFHQRFGSFLQKIRNESEINYKKKKIINTCVPLVCDRG